MQFEGKKILVVDDSTINRDVLKKLLTEFGTVVSTAADGMEAVEMVDRDKFDLVFMDYLMPGIYGTEAVRMIRDRKSDYHKSLPIIIFTTADIESNVSLFKECGANDYLHKPMDRKRLESTMTKWLCNKDVSKEEDDSFENSVEEVSFDVSVGLFYTGNNEVLYGNILSEFSDKLMPKLSCIKEKMEKGDSEGYRVEIHSVKSVSKTVGAVKLSRMAEDLEKKAKDKITEGIFEDLLKIEKEAEVVLGEITVYMDRFETVEMLPYNRERAEKLVEELISFSEDYDFGGMTNSVDEMREMIFPENMEELVHRIGEYYDEIDYDKVKSFSERLLILIRETQ